MKRLSVYEWVVSALCMVCLVLCIGWLFLHRTAPAGWWVRTERNDPYIANRPDAGFNADGLLPGEVIDLNTATRSDLLRLPNIGAVRADAILAYRGTQGAFTCVDELANVSGIGPTTLEQLRPYLSAG